MGTTLVVVGSGSPEHIPDLKKDTGYSGEVVCDPSLQSFEALNFTRNISGLLSSKVLLGGLKAFSSGHRQHGVQGDARQLGGAVVIGPEAQIHYYFRCRQAAEYPPIAEIVKACAAGKATR